MPKLMDLKDMTIGGMRVIKQLPSEMRGTGDVRVMWECQCLACDCVQPITARYLQRRIRKDFKTRSNLKCKYCNKGIKQCT